jgi:hypothetical protein
MRQIEVKISHLLPFRNAGEPTLLEFLLPGKLKYWDVVLDRCTG